MIEGGGLGKVDPDDVGPLETQARNGVVDVVVADEAEATRVGEAAARLLPGGDRRRARRPTRRRCARWSRSGRGAPSPSAPIDRDARRRRLGHLPARALRPGDGHRAGADRGPPARLHRQRLAPHGRRADQRRLRQGGALPAALRRLRAAGGLAARHARASWSARTPRRPGWCGTPRGCWSAARRCGCR